MYKIMNVAFMVLLNSDFLKRADEIQYLQGI